jgi:AcrR family transcriptional regulator
MNTKIKNKREMILYAAVNLALQHGYCRITRDDIAEAAGVSSGLVNHYFETIDKIRKEIIKTAIDKNIVELVAQGLGMRDREVLKAPPHVRQSALNFLSVT